MKVKVTRYNDGEYDIFNEHDLLIGSVLNITDRPTYPAWVIWRNGQMVDNVTGDVGHFFSTRRQAVEKLVEITK